MTTADYLESLQNDLETLKESLDLQEGTNFSDIAQMADDGEITKGGGGGGKNALIDTTLPYDYNNGIRSFLKSIDLIDTSSLTTMRGMFKGCTGLTSVPLFDTSAVKSMQEVFMGCSGLTEIPLFNTSSATSFTSTFQDCTSITTAPQLNTAKVTTFSLTFSGCTALTTVPVLSTAACTNLYLTFNDCPNLTDASINNIMTMCINASKYKGTKTLFQLGFRPENYTAAKIQALDNYQDFVNAGWTIGYS